MAPILKSNLLLLVTCEEVRAMAGFAVSQFWIVLNLVFRLN